MSIIKSGIIGGCALAFTAVTAIGMKLSYEFGVNQTEQSQQMAKIDAHRALDKHVGTIHARAISWDQRQYHQWVTERTKLSQTESMLSSLVRSGTIATYQETLPVIIQRNDAAIWLFDHITFEEFKQIATINEVKGTCSGRDIEFVPTVVCVFPYSNTNINGEALSTAGEAL